MRCDLRPKGYKHRLRLLWPGLDFELQSCFVFVAVLNVKIREGINDCWEMV